MNMDRGARGAARSSREVLLHLAHDMDSSHRDANLTLSVSPSSTSHLRNIYEYYLIVRPHPNLRVLFASRHCVSPACCKATLCHESGDQTARGKTTQAFANGRDITIKIHWVAKTDSYGNERWIRRTPLFGVNLTAAVWIVLVVDDDKDATMRHIRETPLMNPHISSHRSFEMNTICPLAL